MTAPTVVGVNLPTFVERMSGLLDGSAVSDCRRG